MVAYKTRNLRISLHLLTIILIVGFLSSSWYWWLYTLGGIHNCNSWYIKRTDFDKYSFKTHKYIEAVDAVFPSNWEQLNLQLFCPIKYSHSLTSYASVSNSQELILKDIFKRQFLNNNKSECSNPNRKFLILSTNGRVGITAKMHSAWSNSYIEHF